MDIFNKKVSELDDLELLIKYLAIEYMTIGLTQEQAVKEAIITVEETDNVFGYHGLAWSVGKKSLEYFCLYFLSEIFCAKGNAEIAPIHKEIWKDVNDIILGQNIDQKGYILPRGTGKSTFGTLSASVWSACYGFKKMIVICSSTAKLAKKFLSQIKECIKGNKKIEGSFGKLIDLKSRDYKCNDEVIQLLNGVQIEAYGSESSLRGVKNEKLNLRPDLIILDDYQDSKIDVKTEQGRENKWDRYCSDLKYAKQRTLYNANGEVVKKGTVILAFGTVQHKSDFYMRLYNSISWSFRVEKGVLVDDVDKLFNSPKWLEFKSILSDETLQSDEERLYKARQFFYDNKEEMNYPVLWESFWDKVELAKDYYDNPSKFKQEVQSDLDSICEEWVTTLVTKKRNKIEELKFSKTAMSVDQSTGNKKSSDFTAITIGSKYNDFYYIRKGLLEKFDSVTEFDLYIDTLVDLLRKYPITDVFLEKNVFKGVDATRLEQAIEKDKDLKRRRIKVHLIFNTKNKDERISTICPKINNAQIIFCEEDEDYWKQVKSFRGQNFSENDDAIDSLEMLINNIDEIKTTQYIKIDTSFIL
ncbi:hypothetical protein [Inediibacterium massiliense]|uniref:hypothetical protein n=1 Tax=Inediibacterium massiliense TaxID=1658111 RepID=UPI0006B46CF6|nr:hypothetical protein [Inediibacterium massiliense]